MLVCQAFIAALVDFNRGVFIASHQRRRTKDCMLAKGYGVAVIGETGKLLKEFRVFIHHIGDEITQSTVEHDDNNILSILAQRDFREIICNFSRLNLYLSNRTMGFIDVKAAHAAQGNDKREHGRRQETMEAGKDKG